MNMLSGAEIMLMYQLEDKLIQKPKSMRQTTLMESFKKASSNCSQQPTITPTPTSIHLLDFTKADFGSFIK